jgi:uncharacterized membrane protein
LNWHEFIGCNIIYAMWEKHWLLLSILILILGAYGVFVLIWRYWKSNRSTQNDYEQQIPFTLGDLRDMLRRGQIDQKEFKKLRDKIIDDCHGDK